MQLSIALQGIVTQQLLPTADGSGRVCACEVLIPTPAIRNLIREGKTHQIYSAIQTSGATGMQTMDAHLAQLVRQGGSPASSPSAGLGSRGAAAPARRLGDEQRRRAQYAGRRDDARNPGLIGSWRRRDEHLRIPRVDVAGIPSRGRARGGHEGPGHRAAPRSAA